MVRSFELRRMRDKFILVDLILFSCKMALGSARPLTEMSNINLSGGGG
jgi:hypothetical protein